MVFDDSMNSTVVDIVHDQTCIHSTPFRRILIDDQHRARRRLADNHNSSDPSSFGEIDEINLKTNVSGTEFG